MAKARHQASGTAPPMRHKQIGISPLVGTAYPATHLIQLRKAETVGLPDQDGVGTRNVQSVFDDRGGDQHLDFTPHELQHHFFEQPFGHLPVGKSHPPSGTKSRIWAVTSSIPATLGVMQKTCPPRRSLMRIARPNREGDQGARCVLDARRLRGGFQ